MLGKKDYKPKMFYAIQMDQLVPDDHELRKILSLVDFRFVRSKVKDKYSHTGQPGVDPEVIIKLLFLGYYYGILSERQVIKRSQTDIAFRWFLGYDLDEEVPTHSVLSKARTRYGVEVFQYIFDHIVNQCIQAGLVDGKQSFMDATLIEANASEKSLIPRLRVLTPSEYAHEMMKGSPEAEDTSPPAPPRKKKTFNERMVSSTDPEATFYRRPSKKAGLYYQGHHLIDRKCRVIVAATASDTTDSADKQTPPLLLHSKFRHRLNFESFCADAEYGTQRLYHFLYTAGITPFIPPQGTKERGKPFSKEHFAYDRDEDAYRCPEGHRLIRKTYDKSKKRYVYKHEKAGTCKACPHKARCAPGKQDRQIKRLLYQNDFDKAQEVARTVSYKRNMHLRKTLIEPLFGEAKEQHGLNRARSRGLLKVKIQVLFTATVLNIKRLMQYAGNKGHEAVRNTIAPIYNFMHDLERFLTSVLNCQRTFIWSYKYC
jgi:transposase